MGRWITANTLKATIQFETMLIRGVVHYAGRLPNGSPVFRYLLHELVEECNHTQMFQEFINRTGEDVPGMRRGSRIIGPFAGYVGGYANNFHFIGVLCGEQPLHYQQTLQHRGAAQVPPLLNKITYIHLAEEARHITFADVHLAERMQTAGRFRRGLYAIIFPLFLRWLIGESIGTTANMCPTVRGSAAGFQGRLLEERSIAPDDGGIGGRRSASCRGPGSANGMDSVDLATVGYRRAVTAVPR